MGMSASKRQESGILGMTKKLREKWNEALQAVLPIIAALRREGFAELGQKLKEKQLEKRRKIPAKRPETPARSKKTKREHLFANVTDFRQIYEVKSLSPVL